MNALAHAAHFAARARSAALPSATALAYDALAVRWARVWSVAIGGDVLECARNAVTPLALADGEVTQADVIRCVTSALLTRQQQREPGFAHLRLRDIAVHASSAAMLWQVYMGRRAEETRRIRRLTCSTLPAPAGEHCECCGLSGCHGECHDDSEPRDEDAFASAYEREHSAARMG